MGCFHFSSGFVFTSSHLDRGPRPSVAASIAGSMRESLNHFTVSLSLLCQLPRVPVIFFTQSRCLVFFFFGGGGLCTKPYPYSSRGSHLYLCICVRIYMQSRHDLNQWSQTLFPELFLPKDLSANHKHLIVALRSSRSTKTGVRFWFLDETCRKLDPEEEAYCQPTFNLNPSTGFSTSCPIT